jgi:hypothetical protein
MEPRAVELRSVLNYFPMPPLQRQAVSQGTGTQGIEEVRRACGVDVGTLQIRVVRQNRICDGSSARGDRQGLVNEVIQRIGPGTTQVVLIMADAVGRPVKVHRFRNFQRHRVLHQALDRREAVFPGQ